MHFSYHFKHLFFIVTPYFLFKLFSTIGLIQLALVLHQLVLWVGETSELGKVNYFCLHQVANNLIVWFLKTSSLRTLSAPEPATHIGPSTCTYVEFCIAAVIPYLLKQTIEQISYSTFRNCRLPCSNLGEMDQRCLTE